MRSIARSFLFIAAFLFGAVAAHADHMTGTYTGTGQAEGVGLQLQQRGTNLTGSFTGIQGSLTGQTDGGDNASGTAQLGNAGTFRFVGAWSQQGFALTLIGSDGRADFFFASSQQPPAAQPPASQPPVASPPPPPADVQYFLVENGATTGPFSFDQVKQRLAEGRTRREDLIWKPGLPEWVRIDSLPEFAQAAPPAPPPPPPPAQPGPPAPPDQGRPTPPVLLSPGFPGRG